MRPSKLDLAFIWFAMDLPIACAMFAAGMYKEAVVLVCASIGIAVVAFSGSPS